LLHFSLEMGSKVSMHCITETTRIRRILPLRLCSALILKSLQESALAPQPPCINLKTEGLTLGNPAKMKTQTLHIKGAAVLDTMEAIKARAGKEELERIVAHLDAQTREILQPPSRPLRGIPAQPSLDVLSLTFGKRQAETKKN